MYINKIEIEKTWVLSSQTVDHSDHLHTTILEGKRKKLPLTYTDAKIEK